LKKTPEKKKIDYAKVERFRPDLRMGLSQGQVEKRLEDGLCNGENEIKTRSVGKIIRDNIFTPFNILNMILAALVIQPIIGLILLWMGYWKKGWKIAATVVFALWFFAAPLVLGLGKLLLNLFNEPPVNLDNIPPKEEYVQLCTPHQGEELYRLAGDEASFGSYVQIQLTVEGEWIDDYDESGYGRYYRCYTEKDGQKISFLVQDFRQTNKTNLITGDVIDVYGQLMGNMTIPYGESFSEYPCIGMLYLTLQ
jgi:hypothetical protein